MEEYLTSEHSVPLSSFWHVAVRFTPPVISIVLFASFRISSSTYANDYLKNHEIWFHAGMGDGEGLKLDFPTKIHSNRTKIAKDVLCFFNVLDGWLGWAPWAESHHVFIFRYIPPPKGLRWPIG